MQAQIKQWGNSQGIRLNKEILDLADIHLEDTVNDSLVGGNIVLSKLRKRETLEERMERTGLPLVVGQIPDMGQPKGREIW